MIIEIDHIAISSNRFAEHIESMKTLGYTTSFIEMNRENLKIKTKLLHKFHANHDLALLSSMGNIGIELVNHRTIHKSDDVYIIPIFENIPHEIIEYIQEKEIDNIGKYGIMKTFDTPIYISNNVNNANLQFKKFVIKTKNIEKSVIFWKLLGFKIIQNTTDLILLEFKALLNQNIYHLYLQKTQDQDKTHFLDDTGFNCVAFISTSSKNEKNFLDHKGITTTNIEKFILREKTLDIFFAIGPSGEIVEIISIQNN